MACAFPVDVFFLILVLLIIFWSWLLLTTYSNTLCWRMGIACPVPDGAQHGHKKWHMQSCALRVAEKGVVWARSGLKKFASGKCE
jgi:hypothetical protein